MEVCKSWIQIVMYYDIDDLILISITMVFFKLFVRVDSNVRSAKEP